MAEIRVFNPRKSRRRRKRARARATTSKPRRRRRRRVAGLFAANPRRRRRVTRRRSSARTTTGRRRRRRGVRNPSLRGMGRGLIGGATGALMQGVPILGGVVATKLVNGFIKDKLPAEWQSGPQALMVKAGIGTIVIPAIAAAIPFTRRYARPLAIGGALSVLMDAWAAYVVPSFPQLADYESGMLYGYETGLLAGDESGQGSSVYDGGVYS